MTTNTRLTLATLLVASVSLFAGGCSKDAEQVEAEVVRPVKTLVVGGNLAGRLSFPGRVQGARRVELSFRVRGRLQEFSILEGQNVAQSDLIGQLDPTDYQITVQEDQATYLQSEADFTRYQRLYEKDAVPLSDLDRFRAQRDVARARLEQAKTNLGYTTLRAPFGGRLGEKYVENFEDVMANQPVVSLHDITSIEIVMDVPEYLLTDVREGVTITAVAQFETVSNTEYPLTFKEASAQADPQTQTYKVTMIMPQPEGIRVLPGMSALVKVTMEEATEDAGQHAFTVPAAAVFAIEDGTQNVWIVDESMTVKRREVEVGEVTGSASIRVLSGLEPGDRIVTAAVTRLREGWPVTLWE